MAKRTRKTKTTYAVVGSRCLTDRELVFGTLDTFEDEEKVRFIAKVVTGGAMGADRFAEAWARERGVPCTVVRPDYDKHEPKRAPLIRNDEIVRLSHEVIAFWDGQSTGTNYVIQRAMRHHKPVHVFWGNWQFMDVSDLRFVQTSILRSKQAGVSK